MNLARFTLWLLILLNIAWGPSSARADEQRLVIVMPLDHRNAKVDAAGVQILEETIRSAAGSALNPHGYNVLTSETALQLLRDKKIAVEDVEAESALGVARQLGTTLFISATVATSDDKHSMQVRLFDTNSGKQLAAMELGGQTADGLKKSFSRKHEKFFEEALAALGIAAPTQVEADDEPATNDDSEKAAGKKLSKQLKKRCDSGDGAACLERAKLYHFGDKGVRQHRPTAADLYEKACTRGAPAGCTALAVMYRDGDYLDQSAPKAKTFFKRGCDGGDKDACVQLKHLTR